MRPSVDIVLVGVHVLVMVMMILLMPPLLLLLAMRLFDVPVCLECLAYSYSDSRARVMREHVTFSRATRAPVTHARM